MLNFFINIVKAKLQRHLLTNATAPFPLETKLVEQSIPVQQKSVIALETRFLRVNRKIIFRNRDQLIEIGLVAELNMIQ